MGVPGKPKTGDIRTRVCVECFSEFSYEVGRGKDKIRCSRLCDKVSKGKRFQEKLKVAPPCATAGCDKKAQPYLQDGLCVACHAYAWRTGRARDPRRKPYKLTTARRSDGKSYRVLLVPGHPLAMASGGVYHHRLVAYSSRGGICGPCYWCSTLLDWKTAVVDHLNEDGQDDTPTNLVVACNRCNRARGAMLPFFRSLEPERFNELMALMLKQVRCIEGVA